MTGQRKIAVLVGSLRKESFTRKAARTIVAELPEGYTAEEVDLSAVGLYNQDLDTDDPPAVVSVTPGPFGAFGANHHLRQSLVFLNVPVLQLPEMYLFGVGDWFDDQGRLKKDDTRTFLAKFAQAFAAWIEVVTKD